MNLLAAAQKAQEARNLAHMHNDPAARAIAETLEQMCMALEQRLSDIERSISQVSQQVQQAQRMR